ncbi:MAG: hypothetical protein ACREIH_06840 [Nitrospiraceae bacterium]
MQSASFLLVLSLLCPLLAFAGEIRGTITKGGKSIGAGVPVEVRCGEKAYPPTQTDKYGSFRLFVHEHGTCTLHVGYQDQTPTREIESFRDSVRYDLALEKEGEQYVLRRK